MPFRSVVFDGSAAAVRSLGSAWRRAWAILAIAAVALAWSWHAHAAGGGRQGAGAVALLAMIAAQGAAYRQAFGSPVRAFGLDVGRTEARLLLVWLLSAILIAILALLVMVVLVSIAYGVAATGKGFDAAAPATWAAAIDAKGRAALGVIGLLGAAAMAWLALRLALASAATVARGRVQVLASWPLTRGLAVPLLAASVVVSLVPALAAAVLAWHAPAAGPGLWLAALARGFIVAGVLLPLNVGLRAFLYSRLDPGPPAS